MNLKTATKEELHKILGNEIVREEKCELLPASDIANIAKQKRQNYENELKEHINRVVPKLIHNDAKRGKFSTVYFVDKYYADNESIVEFILNEKLIELEKLGYSVDFKTEDFNGTYRTAKLTISWRNLT